MYVVFHYYATFLATWNKSRQSLASLIIATFSVDQIFDVCISSKFLTI